MKCIFLLLLYCSTWNIALNQIQLVNPSNLTSENESINFWEKIDERLYSLVEDPHKQNEIVNIILVYSSDTSNFPDLPNDVNIISSFSIISGQVVTTPVYNILIMAKIGSVERI
ncbi:MAG: hypothetical protein ACTSXK_14065, partial [Promethearchaeota archaeon]